MESLSQIVVGAVLRIERAEEPKLVLLDRTADVAADVGFGKTIGGRAGERKVLNFAHQALGRSITKQIAVKLVATTLGDNVENAAG